MQRNHLVAIGVLAFAGAAFVLAIRGDHHGDLGGDPAAAARARARAVQDEEASAAAAARAAALAPRLAGARPGQPGPLFDAIHFGSAGISVAPAAFQPMTAEAARAGADLGIEPWRLTARVEPEVADRIFHGWGDPPRDHALHDPATHTALAVRTVGAQVELAWTPCETVAHLVDPGDDRPPGQTPFSVLGQRLNRVSIALGDRAQADGSGYTWQLPPMDDGSPMTAALAVDHDVITRVTLQIFVPPDQVAEALRATYGDAGALHLGPWHHGATTITIDGHPPDGATVTATRAPPPP
jgi:hypothetical protein